MKGALAPDEIVSGRYLVEAKVGAGSQGAVYRVRDLTKGWVCALKMLLGEGKELHERFRREGRLGQNLRHPNLVEVFEAEGIHRGRPYFVMELLDQAVSLRQRWPELSWPAFLGVATQVAVALDFLASSGLVHRDLSPDNILIDRGKGVKVIDLGLARDSESALTNSSTGAVLGTPGYLPPEQLRPKDVLPASDQWALAAIVYQRLTGVAPHCDPHDETKRWVALERLADGVPLQPPSELNPTVGKNLDVAVLRALATNPRNRFPTSTAFVTELSSARIKGLKLGPVPGHR